MRSSGTLCRSRTCVLGDPQRRHQLARDARALIALDELQRRAALDDGAMEQPLRRRHRQQRRDLPAAAGLTEDRHRARIAAELRDVVAHPVERCDDVEHADVAGRRELRAAGFAERREAEHVQAVIDRHDDDVAARARLAPSVTGDEPEPVAKPPP